MDVLRFSSGQFKAPFVAWVRKCLFISLFIHFLWLPALLQNSDRKQNRPFSNQEGKYRQMQKQQKLLHK